ncbi:universal stress protein [Halalkalicoccus tibetensis]|uniref:Universal stress protein n=1 Tax=Halalkalicoccus tibetensis TaxID=175632 RepID=A0ABD5V992_9EURY
MPVIAAVDRGEPTDRIVTEGRALADAFDTDLHVVHVLSRSEFVELERTSVEKSGETVDMDRIRDYATKVAKEAAQDGDTCVGLVGDAADQLAEYAEDHDASYLVVGGRRRSPVGKALFGSVTQEVLLSAPVPVVTVLDEED